jgi:hypothetical protein
MIAFLALLSRLKTMENQLCDAAVNDPEPVDLGGAISKSTRAILEAAAAGGEMPLEYMLRIMRDPREPAARRDEMAKAAAPFLHPRMQPTAPSMDDGSPVRPVINLTITRGPSSAEGDKHAPLPAIRNPALQKLTSG